LASRCFEDIDWNEQRGATTGQGTVRIGGSEEEEEDEEEEEE
jgi:hypothetical protein